MFRCVLKSILSSPTQQSLLFLSLEIQKDDVAGIRPFRSWLDQKKTVATLEGF